jgi:predicted DNA binding CopG/RHH family protein
MRTLTKKEKEYLDALINQIDDSEIKAFILADFDTQLDIVEQELDVEESFFLVSSALSRWQTPSLKETFPWLSYKTKTISLRLSPFHIDALKEKSAKTWIKYQTLITMLITQYVNGKITLEV